MESVSSRELFILLKCVWCSPGKSSTLQIVLKDSSDTYLFVNQGLEVQPAHYRFAQNSKSVLARCGLTTVAAIVTSKDCTS